MPVAREVPLHFSLHAHARDATFGAGGQTGKSSAATERGRCLPSGRAKRWFWIDRWNDIGNPRGSALGRLCWRSIGPKSGGSLVNLLRNHRPDLKEQMVPQAL